MDTSGCSLTLVISGLTDDPSIDQDPNTGRLYWQKHVESKPIAIISSRSSATGLGRCCHVTTVWVPEPARSTHQVP